MRAPWTLPILLLAASATAHMPADPTLCAENLRSLHAKMYRGVQFQAQLQGSLEEIAQLSWNALLPNLPSDTRLKLKEISPTHEYRLTTQNFHLVIRRGNSAQRRLGIHLTMKPALGTRIGIDLGWEQTSPSDPVQMTVTGMIENPGNTAFERTGGGILSPVLELIKTKYNVKVQDFDLSRIQKLREEDLEKFSNLVFDPLRSIPILYLPPEFAQSQHQSFREGLMAWVHSFPQPILVVEAETQEAHALLDAVLPEHALSKNSSVRLYMPEITHTMNTDELRIKMPFASQHKHKFELTFFTQEWIPKSIANWVKTKMGTEGNVPLLTLEILEEESRAFAALAELRETREKINSLQAELETARRRAQELESENQKLRTQRSTLAEAWETEKKSRESLHNSLEDLREAFKQVNATPPLVPRPSASLAQSPPAKAMEIEPKNISDVIAWAEQNWPERIRFTERAKRSAKTAFIQDPAIGRKLMQTLAETVYSLVFEESGRIDLSTEVYKRSGVKHASGEGKATSNVPSLQKLRQDVYEGLPIEYTAHLKYNGGGTTIKKLRLHYAVDRENRRLIVGHFGDHLETVRTKDL